MFGLLKKPSDIGSEKGSFEIRAKDVYWIAAKISCIVTLGVDSILALAHSTKKLRIRRSRMFDLIKKAMFTGLGVAYLTKEKLEELSKELIEKGKLSENEGREFVEELRKKSDEAKKGVQEQVEKIVTKTMKKMNVATTHDLDQLEQRLRKQLDLSKGE